MARKVQAGYEIPEKQRIIRLKKTHLVYLTCLKNKIHSNKKIVLFLSHSGYVFYIAR